MLKSVAWSSFSSLWSSSAVRTKTNPKRHKSLRNPRIDCGSVIFIRGLKSWIASNVCRHIACFSGWMTWGRKIIAVRRISPCSISSWRQRAALASRRVVRVLYVPPGSFKISHCRSGTPMPTALGPSTGWRPFHTAVRLAPLSSNWHRSELEQPRKRWHHSFFSISLYTLSCAVAHVFLHCLTIAPVVVHCRNIVAFPRI